MRQEPVIHDVVRVQATQILAVQAVILAIIAHIPVRCILIHIIGINSEWVIALAYDLSDIIHRFLSILLRTVAEKEFKRALPPRRQPCDRLEQGFSLHVVMALEEDEPLDLPLPRTERELRNVSGVSAEVPHPQLLSSLQYVRAYEPGNGSHAL